MAEFAELSLRYRLEMAAYRWRRVDPLSWTPLGVPLRDPEGFLGPAWIRLPLLVLGAFLADVVPRSLWRSRGQLSRRETLMW